MFKIASRLITGLELLMAEEEPISEVQEDCTSDLSTVYLRNELLLNFNIRLESSKPLEALKTLLEAGVFLKHRLSELERKNNELSTKLVKIERERDDVQLHHSRARKDVEAVRRQLKGDQEASRKELCRQKLEKEKLELSLKELSKTAESLKLLLQKNDSKATFVLYAKTASLAVSSKPSAPFNAASHVQTFEKMRATGAALTGFIHTIRGEMLAHFLQRKAFFHERLAALRSDAFFSSLAEELDRLEMRAEQAVNPTNLEGIARDFHTYFSFCDSFDKFLSEDYEAFCAAKAVRPSKPSLSHYKQIVNVLDLQAWLEQHRTALEVQKKFLRLELESEKLAAEAGRPRGRVVERAQTRLRSLEKFIDEFSAKRENRG